MKFYQALVQNENRKRNLKFVDAAEIMHKRLIDELPSGSGFDSGTKLISADYKKIVLQTAFHHMNDNGFYCGWTYHTIVIRPSFLFDIEITISGANRSDIKDYIHECVYSLMQSNFEWVTK